MSALVKPVRERDELYLQWIRTLPCLLLKEQQCGFVGDRIRVEPHHVKPFGGGKIGSKPGDNRSVPLCPKHHDEAEAMGRKRFELEHFLDLEWLVRWLYQKYVKPAPKPKRERRSRIAYLAIQCECGKSHVPVPPSRIVNGLFHCRNLSRWVELQNAISGASPVG